MEAVILLGYAFDTLLGLGLIGLAWQVLNSAELFKAIVLFVAFGLLMALAWVRLNAPDIALAEAAIGAGMTGALLLAALAKLRLTQTTGAEAGQAEMVEPRPGRWPWLPVLVLPLFAVGLGLVIWSLPPSSPGLTEEVSANLDASGVSHPVTAVLINFRGYDTLLEMFVLLLVVVAVWSLGDAPANTDSAPGAVLDNASRLLIPVFVLVAAYLLWVGAKAPGGAFQAGSILGAAGVLLLLAGWRWRADSTTLPMRLILVVGPGVFVVVAALAALTEGHLLEYPRNQAGELILLVETAATFSIGATLVALFLGGRPKKGPERG